MTKCSSPPSGIAISVDIQKWEQRSNGATGQPGVGEARGRETTTVEEAMTRGKRSGEPSRRAKGSQEEEAAGDGPSSRIYGPS